MAKDPTIFNRFINLINPETEMSNVFTNIPEDKIDLNVNTFDWKHQYNMSCQIGEIKPCFCEKLPEHSSISIQPKFAFQLMPMVFPIQTTIVARMSFYKMPIRALWKNYPDWVSSVNQQTHSRYTPPFVNFSSDWSEEEFTQIWGTKSLADFFDVPTTFDSKNNSDIYNNTAIAGIVANVTTPYELGNTIAVKNNYNGSSVPIAAFVSTNVADLGRFGNYQPSLMHGEFLIYPDSTVNFDDSTPDIWLYVCSRTGTSYANYNYTVTQAIQLQDPIVYEGSEDNVYCFDASSVGQSISTIQPEGTEVVLLFGIYNVFSGTDAATSNTASNKLHIRGIEYGNNGAYRKEHCPWYNSSTGQGLKISAYPWRMYDAVYNTYVRYIRNNPLYDIRDQSLPLYNKVTQLYDLADGIPDFTFGNAGTSAFATKEQMLEYATPRFANWEFDQFTTAVQSPQEGVAPLVGLSVYSTQTIDENGLPQVHLQQYVTDEDGKRYQVNMVASEDGVEDITYTEVATVNGRPITSMYQAVSEGISIADFRNVNAYTRYLELNQRRGYRYKDIIEGRYDVKVRFDELLMPEFVGGITREIRMNAITQTVQTVESGTTYDGALGSKAGDGYVVGETQNRISTFLDEKSIIMGIISFTPRPVYTQTLKKWLLDRDILDEWTPEFNALGFQPISNAEVAPIQYFNNEPENLDSTFGYQRPWYDLCAKYDTAHGDYRGPLRNFLMHRVFSGAPKLTREFLQVHPDQVNDVFNVQELTDKIFGQIEFDVQVKTGVSRNAVARLEV